jgi:hypothetical protein
MKAGSQYDAGDGELQRLAGRILSTGKAADGLALAKIVMEQSPKSEGAAMLLSRAYQANGLKVEAIQAMAKAIELGTTPRALLIETDEIRKLSTPEHVSGK